MAHLNDLRFLLMSRLKPPRNKSTLSVFRFPECPIPNIPSLVLHTLVSGRHQRNHLSTPLIFFVADGWSSGKEMRIKYTSAVKPELRALLVFFWHSGISHLARVDCLVCHFEVDESFVKQRIVVQDIELGGREVCCCSCRRIAEWTGIVSAEQCKVIVGDTHALSHHRVFKAIVPSLVHW